MTHDFNLILLIQLILFCHPSFESHSKIGIEIGHDRTWWLLQSTAV